MRLFIFAIGGTGCRVLKSIVMLAAAGVRPVDVLTGKPMKEFEIIPMIIDLHQANADLQRTDSLLRCYARMRKDLYGDQHRDHGFFSVKISTLKSLLKDSGDKISDSFLLGMTAIERLKFKEFIDFNSLNEQNQALISMLFSRQQLETSMNIGFVGSPNIGVVALNRLKDSEEFRAFANVFTSEDRIFFISSIFGGTGAAGFPSMVKNIRNAATLDVTNKGALANARMGALTVLPYFNLEHRADSPVNKADFIVKTQSALHYYDRTLTSCDNPLLDVIYYLGDRVLSTPYTNDPGEGGQKNAAHLIELIGATAPLQFCSISDDEMGSRVLAYEYSLETDTNNVTFPSLPVETRSLILEPLLKFHILSLFLDNKFKSCIGRGFTLDAPVIGHDFLSSNFYRTLTSRFLPKYWDWLEEMDGNNRHVTLFNLDERTHLESLLCDVEVQRGIFGRKKFSYDDIFSTINALSLKKSRKYQKQQLPEKLLDLMDMALSSLIAGKYSKNI